MVAVAIAAAPLRSVARAEWSDMARITNAHVAEPLGLECDVCSHRETDPTGGLEAIMKRGSWAQAMHSAERHLCRRCYRDLDPMAREGYWRSPPMPMRMVIRRTAT